jgi:hypothetical protein
MTTAASAAPFLDVETITANISIVILAVAAVVAGVYKGWREIRKSMIDKKDGDRDIAMLPVATAETYVLRSLATQLEEMNSEIISLRRVTSEHTHELNLNRRAIEAASQGMDKLINALNSFNS